MSLNDDIIKISIDEALGSVDGPSLAASAIAYMQSVDDLENSSCFVNLGHATNCLRCCFRERKNLGNIVTEAYLKKLFSLIESCPSTNVRVSSIRCLQNSLNYHETNINLFTDCSVNYVNRILSVIKSSPPTAVAFYCTRILYLLKARDELVAGQDEVIIPSLVDVCYSMLHIADQYSCMLTVSKKYGTLLLMEVWKYLYIVGSRVSSDKVDPHSLAGLLWGVTASACPVSNSAPPVNMLLHCFCDVLLTLPHNHGNIYELQIQCFQLLSTVPEELWKGVYEHAGVAAPDQLPLRVINFLKTCTYLLECELSHVQYAVSVTGSTTHETSTKATTRLVPLMAVLTRIAKVSPAVRTLLKSLVLGNVVVGSAAAVGEVQSGDVGGLKAKCLPMLISFNTDVRRVASELMFLLCNSNAKEYVDAVGVGSAVGLLQIKGLMGNSGV